MKEYVPYEYQEFAKQHVIDKPSTGLFLDMGLGKTIITLSAIVDLMLMNRIKTVLIVAPLRVANTVWRQEAAKWVHTSWLKVNIVTGTKQKREKALSEKADIYVINRENVKWLCEYYNYTLPYDMGVWDELTSFKSHSSQRFKCLKKCLWCFKYLVGLTGTPIGNGYMDLWSEIYLIDRGQRLFEYISHYRQTFFTQERVGGNEFALGYTLIDGMDKVINDRISDICLSMKTEDYLQLPDLIIEDVYVDLPDAILEGYRRFERDKILSFGESDLIADSAASLCSKLLQYSNGACYVEEGRYTHIHDVKLEALLTLIEKANGEPVLLAYNFRHDLYRIMEATKAAFPDLDIRHLTTDQDVYDWNARKINVLITHPASSAWGLNLQEGGNIMIWFGLTWSLEYYQQFLKRLHRNGVTQKVICYRILTRDTYDEVVKLALAEKDATQETLMEYLKAYKQLIKETC